MSAYTKEDSKSARKAKYDEGRGLIALRRAEMERDSSGRYMGSDIVEACKELGRSLSPTRLKEALGLQKDRFTEAQIRVHVSAINGFMQAVRGELASDTKSKMASLLRADKLFEKAELQIDGINQGDKTVRRDLKAYLGRNADYIKSQLDRIDLEQAKQMVREIEGTTTKSAVALTSTISLNKVARMKKIEAYKSTIVTTLAYFLAGVGVVVAMELDSEYVKALVSGFAGAMIQTAAKALVKKRERSEDQELIRRVLERQNRSRH